MAGAKNTLGRPPRLPNGAAEDTIAIVEYLTDIYKALVLEGQIAARVRTLEEEVNNQSFPSRTLFVRAAADLALSFEEGVVVEAGGVEFRRQDGASVIPDLPGWLPVLPVTPQHAGEVQPDATAAIVGALGIAEAMGQSLISIPPGGYTVSGEIVIPHAITRVEGYGAKIIQMENASIFTRYGVISDIGGTVNPINAGVRVVSASSAVTDEFAANDWALLRANNLIPTYAAGSRVSVLRQIESVSSGVLRLDGPVNRQMDNSPLIRKVYPAPPITLAGLTLENVSQDNIAAIVSFFLTLDPTFVECRIGHNGGTAVRLVYTINGEWLNSHTYDLRDDEDNGYLGYGMALSGAVRGFRFTSGTSNRVRHAITTLSTFASGVPDEYEGLLVGRGEPEHCVYGPNVHAFNTSNPAFDTHPEGFGIEITPNAFGCFGGVNIRATHVYVVGGLINSCRREAIRVTVGPSNPAASLPIRARVSGTVINNIGEQTDRVGIRCSAPGAEIEIEGVRINGVKFGLRTEDGCRMIVRDVMVDCAGIADSIGVELAGQNSDIDGLTVRNATTGISETATGSGNAWTRYRTEDVATPVSRVPSYASAPPTPFPVYTTTQRDALASPQVGWVIFNSTTGTVQAYNGSAWV